MSFLDDLRNLDRNNVGGWSTGVKAFFAILIIAVILFLGWYLKISAQQEELDTARQQEVTAAERQVAAHRGLTMLSGLSGLSPGSGARVERGRWSAVAEGA